MKEFDISLVYVKSCLLLVYTTVVLPGTRNSLCWYRTGVWWSAVRINSGRGTVSIYTVLSVVACVFGLGLTWKLLYIQGRVRVWRMQLKFCNVKLCLWTILSLVLLGRSLQKNNRKRFQGTCRSHALNDVNVFLIFSGLCGKVRWSIIC